MTQLAFLFPGQGSQSLGMLSGWGDNTTVQDVLSKANDALGVSLTDLIANGPAESLNLTVNTQPAMLAAAYAAYSAWLAAGGAKPVVAAGHSLGEYTAWVAAGSMDLADALRTVRIRGAAMQAAVPVGVGAMAAILGLDSKTVHAACQSISTSDAVVEAVNYNDPNQTVIAGHVAGVNAGVEACKAAGAKRGLLLAVSAPFHSSLMRPVAAPLTEHLASIQLRPPNFTVINNVDVAQLTEGGAIKHALVRQSYSAVRWVETLMAMDAMGVTTFIECGPGKALAGMVKRTLPNAVVHNVFDQASLQAALQATHPN